MIRSFKRFFLNSEELPREASSSLLITLFPQCFISSSGNGFQREPTQVAVHVQGWVREDPNGTPFGRKDRVMLSLLRRYVGLPPQETVDSNLSLPEGIASMNATPSVEHIKKSRESKGHSQSEPNLRYCEQETENVSTGQSNTSARSYYSLSSFVQKFMIPSKESSYISSIGLKQCEHNFMTRSTYLLSRPVKNKTVLVRIYSTDDNFQEHCVAEFKAITDPNGYFILKEAIPYFKTRNNKFSVEAIAIRSFATSEQARAVLNEVPILSRTGVSVISDIDDTVKNTRVVEGPKKVAENTLLAPLTNQYIEGVSDWLRIVTNLGATLHFVSNSPWQLWPMISEFFDTDNIPFVSSLQLRHFSSVIQNLVEPAAQRKRAGLIHTIRNLGDRKVLLIGDNGEQDLEIYAEIATCFPDRVLGIFIRDVKSDFHANVQPKGTNDTSHLNTIATTAPTGKSGEHTANESLNTKPKDVDNEQASEYYQLEQEQGTEPSTFQLHRYYTYRIFVEDKKAGFRKPKTQVEHAVTRLPNVHYLTPYSSIKYSNNDIQDWYIQLARARGQVAQNIPIVMWRKGEECISFTKMLIDEHL
ncbi:actin cortical patch protein [Schizosaccharomyces cryophilus OY26]|uniref:Actin cortical patch protein n=1 Tax=Schizosaccharomyces cryophilus (strain OY26 / ATCC MYA-4695 / CBS 11777 / NBRC 106824 / NRRL Y48691) TaxID=653667 RepID=S9VSM3_SCHCR|nr:actin cortical patch protein [Schizosaccharomyces cryophilus OY26]EPY49184.1 actin cortical patch protein [Schizosaccharomyces cryophilus OY26]